MKERKKTGVRNAGPNEAIVRKARFYLSRIGGSVEQATLFLKLNVRLPELFSAFPVVFSPRDLLQESYGTAFPRFIAEVFSKSPKFSVQDPLRELAWAVCRCLLYTKELSEHAKLRLRYENSVIAGNLAEAIATLDLLEATQGYSLWLIENRLALAQVSGGTPGLRSKSQEYEAAASPNSTLSVLISLIRRRIESTALKGQLHGEIDEVFSNPESSYVLRNYFRFRVLDMPSVLPDHVGDVLCFEAHSCIVDLYETTIAVLEVACASGSLPDEIARHFQRPLQKLWDRTQDHRLLPILRAIGVLVGLEEQISSSLRLEAIEAYTEGKYTTAISRAREYLASAPWDIAIHTIRLKSHLRSNAEPMIEEGLLGDIQRNLFEVFKLGAETYTAAFNLLTLTNRFYWHTWSKYLRALVSYELRQESGTFPPKPLTQLFCRDQLLSPFSTSSVHKDLQQKLLLFSSFSASCPMTVELYRAAATGTVTNTATIDQARLEQYFGIHAIHSQKAARAIAHFERVVSLSNTSQSVRSLCGIALAQQYAGNRQDAAHALVQAYLSNPHVPNILPIEQIVEGLGASSSWPISLEIPLALELYVEYVSTTKLPELRYSFERVQKRSNIKGPTDFKERISSFGSTTIAIAYLDRVWRPEVMRQTVLYKGSREIEEERVEVCKVLAEIDPDNVANYSDEIKDRVKQLEITKALSLVEQTKIFVDTDAIRKSLRQKLNDSYARYKSVSSKSSALQIGAIIAETIAESVAHSNQSIPITLSKMYLLDEPETSEGDAQFDAIYLEVTKEFLHGQHGLNAFLSTRIRHGTLANTLRKPAEDERLVTPRNENKPGYVKNEYWKGLLGNSLPPETLERVTEHLGQFSADLDNVIEFVKDHLIQIRASSRHKESSESSDALFGYHSSNVERSYVRQLEGKMSSLDEFMNYCIDLLWEKTDLNLRVVQEVLANRVKNQFMDCYTNLSNNLNKIQTDPSNMGDLHNAISRARIQTTAKLQLVASWFRRSEVFDRQDYIAEFPFNIALRMAQNTISAAASWNGATCTTNTDGILLPGRTLDGLTYAFYGLIENAILRSQLDISELRLSATVSFLNGRFVALLKNNVADALAAPQWQEKVRNHERAVLSGELASKGQVEGKSGLYKIWQTICSPIYRDPSLKFRLDNNEFIVELEFSLAGQDS